MMTFWKGHSQTCILNPGTLIRKYLIVFLPTEHKINFNMASGLFWGPFLCALVLVQHQDPFCPRPFLSAPSCSLNDKSLFPPAVFQMQRRDRPRGFPWMASSITPPCCSARRTTCCTSEPGRRCLPSASRTSAGPSSRRTLVVVY